MRRQSLLLLLLFLALKAAAQQQTDVVRQEPAGRSVPDAVDVSLNVRPTGSLLGFGRRAKPGEEPPKALLIELLTRQNQREYLVKARPDLLPTFDHDVSEVIRRTVLDWSTYFRFCPLYFFADTMADRVKAGEWAGVLLDSEMKPVAKPALSAGEKNFYIAYFGSPIPQPEQSSTASPTGQNPERDYEDVTSLIRERLLVMDSDFRMLPENKPRTNYVRAIRPKNMSTPEYGRYRRSITYNASRWYIDYRPVAYSYDATLRRYFRTN